MHGAEHGDIAGDTKSRLKCLFKARGRDEVAVFDDVRIDWKTPGVDPACPDVSVVFGMSEERAKKVDVFDEEKEGTSPCFVLEVTSKKTASDDRKSKLAIYRKGKVSEIFLLDRKAASPDAAAIITGFALQRVLPSMHIQHFGSAGR